MINFIKSLDWFIKKNWYRYVLILIVGLLLTVINLFPARIIANLTAGVDNGTLSKEFLIYEKNKYFKNNLDFLKCFIKREKTYMIWNYQKLLRIQEYYYNKRKEKLNCLPWILISRKKNKRGLNLGIEIPENTCDKGLFIWHSGFIVINARCKIGKDCQLHGNNCIGNKSVSMEAPIIGDNCDVGVGAKILGGITIGDNVVIGASAVVVKDIKSNVVVCGVPAKIVKEN